MQDAKTLRIFLAELGHTYFGISPASIPLGVAYISATLKERFKDNLEIKIFRYPEKLQEALKEERPDILGFGLYNWNENLSMHFAQVARQAYPGVLLVAGGLNIPGEISEIEGNYIHNNKSLFDVYIPYEGELPMVELTKHMLGAAKKDLLNKAIPGCYIYGNDGLLKENIVFPQLGDLSRLPSPYLSGTVDHFLDDQMLNSIIQTMRGCPYQCSFCVSGNKNYSKIRLFPIERVKEELLYLSKRAKNRILRMTDDNFGIVARDSELAEFIAKLHKDNGYPQALKVYTNKTNDERVRKIMLMLKEFIPYNISLQTMAPSALKEIHRKNLSLNEITEVFRWAKKNNIITATEIMHGLPGETYESHLAGIQNIYKIRADSVSCHETWLLPNTGLVSKANREKYKIVSRFTLGPDALSIIEGEVFCEFDEILVGSKDMSTEEHYQLRTLDLFVALTLHYGYFREFIYHALTFGINPVDIFKDIIALPYEYPVLNKMFSSYDNKIRGSHFITEGDAYQHVKFIINSSRVFPPTRFISVVIGTFIFGNEFEKGVDEFIRSINKLYKEDDTSKEEFNMICQELKQITVKMVLNPERQNGGVYIVADYDFPQWVNTYYEEKLSNLKCKPIKLKFSIPNPEHLNDIYERGRRITDASERIQFFFRHTNSSGIRRRMSYA